MNIREAKDYLSSFVNHELLLDKKSFTSFHLKRITLLLSLLRNPQKNLKIIHVAGSKGKGSTAAMIAEILKQSGYRVGLYTSPHFYHFRERIRILSLKNKNENRQELFSDCISERDFYKTLRQLKPFIEKVRRKKQLGFLSFFEVMTAFALFYFKKKNVDMVILETGLGGRLDATNAANGFICVLTPISLEHTQLLGSTIEKIACEKAAIIKSKNQSVVIAAQNKKAFSVFMQRCRMFGIHPYDVRQMIPIFVRQNLKSQEFHLKTKKSFYQNLKLPLLGRHQCWNAATSIATIELLQNKGFQISEDAIENGIKNVFWPGRFEIFDIKGRKVVLDAAHNPASIKELVKTLKNVFVDQKMVIILGLSQDKDKKGICQQLRQAARCVIATQARHPRAMDFTLEELKRYFPQKICYSVSCLPKALALSLGKTHRGDIILITGSVFLVSEARKLCRNLKK